MIITMTSVGYGDIYPKTFFGRIVGVMICFWGVLILSFFVVTVTNILSFSINEEKAFNVLCRLQLKSELKIKAVSVLQAAYIYRNCKNENKDSGFVLSKFRNFRTHLINFK